MSTWDNDGGVTSVALSSVYLAKHSCPIVLSLMKQGWGHSSGRGGPAGAKGPCDGEGPECPSLEAKQCVQA